MNNKLAKRILSNIVKPIEIPSSKTIKYEIINYPSENIWFYMVKYQKVFENFEIYKLLQKTIKKIAKKLELFEFKVKSLKKIFEFSENQKKIFFFYLKIVPKLEISHILQKSFEVLNDFYENLKKSYEFYQKYCYKTNDYSENIKLLEEMMDFNDKKLKNCVFPKKIQPYIQIITLITPMSEVESLNQKYLLPVFEKNSGKTCENMILSLYEAYKLFTKDFEVLNAYLSTSKILILNPFCDKKYEVIETLSKTIHLYNSNSKTQNLLLFSFWYKNIPLLTKHSNLILNLSN